MKALIIVDVQKGFVNIHTKHIVHKIETIQTQYDHVFASRFFNELGSPYRRFMNWKRFDKGSDDFELAFSPAANVRVFDKPIYTCVGPALLDQLLASSIDEVDICGIDTDVCVSITANDFFQIGIRPTVLAFACASHAGITFHDSAIAILKRTIGIQGVSLDETSILHDSTS